MTWFFIIAAILCLVYFVVLLLYVGFGGSALYIWPILSECFGLLAFWIHLQQKHPASLRIRVSVITAVCAAAAIFLAVEGLITVSAVTASGREAADYCIVLGARVRGRELSSSLERRLRRAYIYAVAHPKCILVLSGGQGEGEDLSEAEAMYGYLYGRGIRANRFILEDKSENTVENIRNSLSLIRRWEADTPREEKVAIVTSNFHIFRAKHIAEKLGQEDVITVASSADPILVLHLWVREGLAVLKDKFMGRM